MVDVESELKLILINTVYILFSRIKQNGMEQKEFFVT